ncbi:MULTISPECIES: arsenate reductase (glutaredoxin) [Pseudomonadota]|jgi:arsenate reductase|uniref:arsenate reductase (glutaredoxin) n=1 Tax=Pseudomonadota TaxID=1224 RepID=UPI00076AAE3D|nr:MULTISPECIES: arsenate reductase (glutaredoxin) [Pseudomonadota]MAF60095.1 arsenate reductase (glutaredoxin) [Blastomonas sp.]|tara:strand:+ start:30951 stop:31298 length:348 start_codon:yes stop_codon:yes gene_type:complete
MPFTIYHNPKCGTSRNVLAALREAGHEPEVIEYLKTPPSRETLESLIKRAGEGARALLRAKEPLVKELGLDGADVTDAAIVDAMMAHPVLINRPIVVTETAVKLCRPSETVQALL